MYQQFYADHRLMIFPVIGLCIFFVAFLLVLGWVFFGLRHHGDCDDIASLPLADDAGVKAPREESHE